MPNLNGKHTPGAGQTLVLEDELPVHHLELPDGTLIAYQSPMDLSERDEMKWIRARRLLDMAQTRMNRAKNARDEEKAVSAYIQAQNAVINVLLPEMPDAVLKKYNRYQKNQIIMFWNEQYAGIQRAAERALDDLMGKGELDEESLGEG